MLNALLAFGMETTYFRYLNKYENDKQKVYNNTFFTVSLMALIFLLFTFLFVDDIAAWIQKGDVYDPDYARYIKYFMYILVADALAVIPFAKVRADGRPLRYSFIKFVNILTFIGLNLLFIFVFPLIIKEGWYGAEYIMGWYREGWVGYVFISNLIASLITLLLLVPELLKLTFTYDIALVKEMFVYSLPVLIANISFIINENIDKIFLGQLLPPGISVQEVGIYAACCKIAVFLSIFINAFRLGAEPFFFSHASNENAPQTYATITKYFVIFGSFISLCVIVFADLLKILLLDNETYWSAMKVVPLIVFANFFLGIYTNLSVWYKLINKTKIGAYISLVGAAVTLALNYLLIPLKGPFGGYYGSAIATIAAYGSMMALSYYLGRNKYPIPYDRVRIFGYLTMSILFSAISFYIPYIRENYYIKIGILFVFLYFIYYSEKETLLRIIKRKK